LFALKMYS